jgi:small GTP-binding protein
MHKAGFVNIVGNPNAGKSTLMNQLVGERLSIITSKAQTTRHRIMGIVNGENFQIIYSDTPGILRKMSYKMHETMMKTVRESLEDSDVIVLLIDIQNPSFSEDIQTKFNKFTGKKIVCLNKIDTINQEKLEAGLLQIKEQFAADFYLPISAKEKFQVDRLEQQVLEYLPVHPPYFDGEDVIVDICTDDPNFDGGVSPFSYVNAEANFSSSLLYPTRIGNCCDERCITVNLIDYDNSASFLYIELSNGVGTGDIYGVGAEDIQLAINDLFISNGYNYNNLSVTFNDADLVISFCTSDFTDRPYVNSDVTTSYSYTNTCE